MVEALLCSRLNSIRAAFEAFIQFAALYRQRDAFQFLVKLGATYNWLASSTQGHLFLLYATAMDLVSTLHVLLDNGCRPDSPIDPHALPSDLYPAAIIEALRGGNLRCVQLLLERCDVNKRVMSTLRLKLTNFEHFLKDLGNIGELSEIGLSLFLQAGANLDKPINRLMKRASAPMNWSISVVDYLFYFHRPLFHTLPSELVRTRSGHLSRAGVLLSLEGGIQSLETYLSSLGPLSDQQQLAEFFQQLIAEQFLMRDLNNRKRETDLKIVRALMSSHVSFGASMEEVLSRFSYILHSFSRLTGHECHRSQTDVALYLVRNGATVTGQVLSWMAGLPDTRLLDLTLGSIKSPRGLEIAVAKAAERNNFKAIERLLHAGARLDIDIQWRESDYEGPFSIIARVILYHKQVGLSEMLDFLVTKGAPLRLSKMKPHLHHLLQFTLESEDTNGIEKAGLLERVKYIVGAGYNLRHSPYPTASLLEECGTWQVFEYLYRNGAQPRPGSPLARWIALGGGIDLCREMLKAGADPNAYSGRMSSGERSSRVTPLQAAARKYRVDIVELLLQEGSDVNAPAKGYGGKTALQASCWHPWYSPEDQQQKLRTIRLLLAHSANVNAAPARKQGKTALQEAAASGDLLVAKQLLFHNQADVNAPPCAYMCARNADPDEYEERRVGTALDYAAESGRIDMVKLLLDCNAISHYRGKTGYDGAIQEAQRQGHLAVADLICKHAEDAEKGGFKSPELSEPPRDWREYGYESDSDVSRHSEDEEESIPFSEADDPGVSERDWMSDAVGTVSSEIHRHDPFTEDHDRHSPQPADSFIY